MLFENLLQLKLNKLSRAQFENVKASGGPTDTELYLVPDADVSYNPQEPTPEQQAQARENIGVGFALEKEIEKLAPIDFSSIVDLFQRYDGEYPDFTITSFPTKEYVYVPLLRMVFFNIDLIFTGKLKKGDIMQVGFGFSEDPNGDFHKPRSSSYTFPVTSRSARFSAEHLPDEISIRVNEDIDAEGISDSIGLSGWYFCD